MPPESKISRPFSVLRKLVSRGEVRLAPENDKPVAPPRHVDASLSEEDAFAQAMGEVRPLGWSKAPLRLPRPIELPGSGEEEGEKETLRRLEAFVDGEGDLDPFATGEGVEGAATERGRRYLGRLKKGEFSVQAHPDLHGMVSRRRPRSWSGFCDGPSRSATAASASSMAAASIPQTSPPFSRLTSPVGYLPGR